jgi:hypothetical protein
VRHGELLPWANEGINSSQRIHQSELSGFGIIMTLEKSMINCNCKTKKYKVVFPPVLIFLSFFLSFLVIRTFCNFVLPFPIPQQPILAFHQSLVVNVQLQLIFFLKSFCNPLFQYLFYCYCISFHSLLFFEREFCVLLANQPILSNQI